MGENDSMLFTASVPSSGVWVTSDTVIYLGVRPSTKQRAGITSHEINLKFKIHNLCSIIILLPHTKLVFIKVSYFY